MGSEGVWSVVGAGADAEDGLEPGVPAEASPTEGESIDGAWVGAAGLGVEMGAAVIGTGSAVAGGVVVEGAGVDGDVVVVGETVVGVSEGMAEIGGDMVGTDGAVFGVGGAVAGADAVVMDGLAVGVSSDRAEDELTDCDGCDVRGIVGDVVVFGVGVSGGVEGEMGKGAAMGLYGRI